MGLFGKDIARLRAENVELRQQVSDLQALLTDKVMPALVEANRLSGLMLERMKE